MCTCSMVVDVAAERRAKMTALWAPSAVAQAVQAVPVAFRMLGRFVPVGAKATDVRAAVLAAGSSAIRYVQDDQVPSP